MARTRSGTGAQTNTVNIFTAGQSGAIFSLVSSGGFTPIDFADGNNFELVMTENTTLENPVGNPGTGGNITIIQDNTTPYTLSFDTNWRSVDGTTPTISTTLGAENNISYYRSNGVMWYSLSTGGIA
jgi:hypothetical protein